MFLKWLPLGRGKFVWLSFKLYFLKICSNYCQTPTNNKSALVQVMTGGEQATNYYLNQCWPRSMTTLYSVNRPRWVNTEHQGLCVTVCLFILAIIHRVFVGGSCDTGLSIRSPSHEAGRYQLILSPQRITLSALSKGLATATKREALLFINYRDKEYMELLTRYGCITS